MENRATSWGGRALFVLVDFDFFFLSAVSVVFHLGAALKAYERHVDTQQAELDKIQHMPEDTSE